MSMRNVGVRMEGLQPLIKKLAKLAGPEFTRKAMDSALEEGVHIYKDRMQELVQVDTGKTRDRIRVLVKNRDWAAVADTPLAHLLEFGTVKSKAYPFIRPAADQMKNTVIRSVSNRLSSEVDRIANQ